MIILNRFAYLISLAFFLANAVSAKAQSFNIKDYGAVADGTTLSTPFIQKAIDACSSKGGGTVYVPAGSYKTGTIHLRSNINLYLERGAILQGSKNLPDYDSYTLPVYGLNYYGILYTKDAENISITGYGDIDGNNSAFFDFASAKTIDTAGTKFTRQKYLYRHVESGIGDGPVVPKDRPRQMVIFSNCKNIKVENVSLINSPFWTLHFADCDNVKVDSIRLWSGLLVPNADGIDVTSSSNVIISNCDIRTGDDAIAITGYDHHFEIPGFNGIKHPSENIIVTNCNLQSYSSGIRIGFLDQNSVKNIQVSHVNITNSTRGIGIFLRDEGSLENISFSDMNIETHLRTGDWWGNGEPIHISAVRGKEQVKLGTIRHVSFNNINCIGENGILIYGSPESIIKDVRFNHITFNFKNSKLNKYAGGNIDLRGALYPKEQLFKSDIPGLLAKNISELSIDNFKLVWDPLLKGSYFTNGLEVTNFNDLNISAFKGTGAPAKGTSHRMVLTNGRGLLIDNNKDVIKHNVL